MSAKEDIKRAIKLLGAPDGEMYSIACTVDNIDETAKTCDCSPIDGRADILGVRLVADDKKGFLVIPKDGSIVLVSMLNDSAGYIAMFSEIDKILIEINDTSIEITDGAIKFNDGAFDGLVKVADLTEKLNNLENAFNQHLLLYNAHTHAGVTAGASVTAIPAPDTQTLTPTTQSEIENETITHG